MGPIALHLQGKDGGEMLVCNPLAGLFDGLSNQPQDRPRRARKGVEFGSALAAIVILDLPNLMGAARKAMEGFCDLDRAKLFRPMRSWVFLDQGGDGQDDSNKMLWLDASHTKPRQGDPSPLGR